MILNNHNNNHNNHNKHNNYNNYNDYNDYNNEKNNSYCIKMEFQKTISSLNTTSNNKNLPRFVTKTKVYDQSEKNYNNNKENWINTPFVLRIKHDIIV